MPSIEAGIGYLTGSAVTALAFILVSGAFRVWVYGYVDKAKDAQIERLTATLEKSLETNRMLLGIIEAAKHG